MDFGSKCRVLYAHIEAYYQTSGQLMNLQKFAIIFSPKTKIQMKQAIRERLKIQELIGTLTYLVACIMRR